MPRKLVQQAVIGAFALALLAAPVATFAPAPALATQTPGAFHWARKTSQFTLQVGDNVDGDWNGMLGNVVSDWNKGGTVTFRVVGGATNPQECRPRTGTVQMCNWQYGTQVGWLGLTRLYFNDRGDHIDAATVQMNDSFLNAANSRYNSEAARRHTMCHELGHTPGLDHVDTNSCMNDSQNAVFNNVKPINDDFQQLTRIYRHTDPSSTVAGAKNDKKKKNKKNGNNKKNRKNRGTRTTQNTNRPRDARATSESFFDPASIPAAPDAADGTQTVTVERLDDGTKVVSFITWANE